jgi:hypothetical protein
MQPTTIFLNRRHKFCLASLIKNTRFAIIISQKSGKTIKTTIADIMEQVKLEGAHTNLATNKSYRCLQKSDIPIVSHRKTPTLAENDHLRSSHRIGHVKPSMHLECCWRFSLVYLKILTCMYVWPIHDKLMWYTFGPMYSLLSII